jgi:hypothetical protein
MELTYISRMPQRTVNTDQIIVSLEPRLHLAGYYVSQPCLSIRHIDCGSFNRTLMIQDNRNPLDKPARALISSFICVGRDLVGNMTKTWIRIKILVFMKNILTSSRGLLWISQEKCH